MSTTADIVEARIAALPAARQEDARALHALFSKLTGWEPRLWNTVIGYGSYAYAYKSGRTGEWAATGFSPQRGKHAIHIMPGYTDFPEITARLGPHERGKSCFYIKRLSDVDEAALADLIRAGLDDLGTQYEVVPT